jgi:hypothetical protein
VRKSTGAAKGAWHFIAARSHGDNAVREQRRAIMNSENASRQILVCRLGELDLPVNNLADPIDLASRTKSML